MSRINVHRVETEEHHGGRDEIVIPPVHEGNQTFSRRDGEELSAAAAIIGLLDDLDNGEALVIYRELW